MQFFYFIYTVLLSYISDMYISLDFFLSLFSYHTIYNALILILNTAFFILVHFDSSDLILNDKTEIDFI